MTSKPVPITTSKLVPHTKESGIDICASGDYVFIIRSDLGCYMRCINGHLDWEPDASSKESQQLNIYSLNPACSGYDHYLHNGETFFLIKGERFIRVSDLTAPGGIPIKEQLMSKRCQNGDHYLSVAGTFIIIFNKTQTYLVVSDLATGDVIKSGMLILSAYKNGLYYYGAPNNTFHHTITVISENQWGVVFINTTDLSASDCSSYFVYPDVINFLPGGPAVTFGSAEAKWVPIKTLTNKSKASLEWSETITKRVGYNKSHFNSMENNWSFTKTASMGTKFESGLIVQASLEAQFSLEQSSGGVNIRSQQEDWNEAYTTEETISTTIEPQASVYIWQFILGLKGTATVLFCRDLQMTDNEDPPTNIPLPRVI